MCFPKEALRIQVAADVGYFCMSFQQRIFFFLSFQMVLKKQKKNGIWWLMKIIQNPNFNVHK